MRQVEPLRIGFATYDFPVLSEPFVSTLAIDMAMRDHEISVMTLNPERRGVSQTMHEEVERTGIADLAIHAAPRTPWGKAMAKTRMGRFALRARMARHAGPFDIVHCHFATLGLPMLSLRKKRFLNTRALIVHFRGYDITTFVDENGKDIYRDLFDKADLFIANCEYFKQRAVALGCDPDKIEVIGSPLDAERFVPPNERRPYRQRPLEVVAIGRLVAKKGFATAIEAAAIAGRRGLDLRLTILGDGPLRQELQAQICDLGLEAIITLKGRATQQQIVEALHRSDIALAPSVRDNSGNEDAPVNTLKEAMATGLPVVATRHGGIPELVRHGENGLLVEEYDAAGLAGAIIDLAERTQDWAAMGGAGRARVLDMYERGKVCDRTLAAYHRALSS
ncbi:glycosyltransferase [Qipengyuania sp.]|uniref:glycosyltransferase n=1 Tax=Qipengyuania sp. TaxID=2004515 RepID=UPI0035C7A371